MKPVDEGLCILDANSLLFIESGHYHSLGGEARHSQPVTLDQTLPPVQHREEPSYALRAALRGMVGFRRLKRPTESLANVLNVLGRREEENKGLLTDRVKHSSRSPGHPRPVKGPRVRIEREDVSTGGREPAQIVHAPVRLGEEVVGPSIQFESFWDFHIKHLIMDRSLCPDGHRGQEVRNGPRYHNNWRRIRSG
jgi:hypothetical protein